MASTPLPHPLIRRRHRRTNARFAWVRRRGRSFASPRACARPIMPVRRRPCATWRALSAPRRARSSCAAPALFAGVRCQLTNAGWLIDGHAVAAALGLEGGLLLNDFEAQRSRFRGPGLQPARHRARPRRRRRSAACARPRHRARRRRPAAGVRTLRAPRQRWGHVDLAPGSPEEGAVFAATERVGGPPRRRGGLVGGRLVRLHRARCHVAGTQSPHAESAAVVAAAVADPASLEAGTVRMFLDILARFAGDMAIASAPRAASTLPAASSRGSCRCWTMSDSGRCSRPRNR